MPCGADTALPGGGRDGMGQNGMEGKYHERHRVQCTGNVDHEE